MPPVKCPICGTAQATCTGGDPHLPMGLVDIPRKAAGEPIGGYRAPEHIYADAAGEVCAADDPRVDTLLHAKGSLISKELAEKLGLVEAEEAEAPAPKKPARKRTTKKETTT